MIFNDTRFKEGKAKGRSGPYYNKSEMVRSIEVMSS
jgi:hypothetical protein